MAAESFRIPVSLIFNKSDLYDDQISIKHQELAGMYQKIGYNSYLVSAETGKGVEEIKKATRGMVILITGHSGVGKSTLLNKISPEYNQKILPVSNFSNKGVHTTTFAEMFDIGNDAFLIDTPGIKEFGLSEIEDEEISHYFPEMRALIGKCKYHNCMHKNEPKCAVLEAIEKGEIAISRYRSYLSMLENEDNRK